MALSIADARSVRLVAGAVPLQVRQWEMAVRACDAETRRLGALVNAARARATQARIAREAAVRTWHQVAMDYQRAYATWRNVRERRQTTLGAAPAAALERYLREARAYLSGTRERPPRLP